MADEGWERGAQEGRAGANHDHIGRRLRTLEDCALHKRTLRLTCPKCGHVRVFDGVALWWMFHRRGWDGTLGVVGRRLCCSACQAEGRIQRPHVVIGRDQPTGAALPYPDSATWKKLVSRYRS